MKVLRPQPRVQQVEMTATNNGDGTVDLHITKELAEAIHSFIGPTNTRMTGRIPVGDGEGTTTDWAFRFYDLLDGIGLQLNELTAQQGREVAGAWHAMHRS